MAILTQQNEHDYNNLLKAMKYEPTVVSGTAPVSNYSASSLTTGGMGVGPNR